MLLLIESFRQSLIRSTTGQKLGTERPRDSQIYSAKCSKKLHSILGRIRCCHDMILQVETCLLVSCSKANNLGHGHWAEVSKNANSGTCVAMFRRRAR